jgi:hypothetical protein
MLTWLSFAHFQRFHYYSGAAGRADAGYIKNKANLSLQAKLDLKLRLSLAIYVDDF